MSLRDAYKGTSNKAANALTKTKALADEPASSTPKAPDFACPGYLAQAGQKLCVRYHKPEQSGGPGTCSAIGHAPCVEWMRGRATPSELKDTERLVSICIEPDAAKARAMMIAMIQRPRLVMTLGVDASDEHLARLEALKFQLTMDAPFLGEVKIVTRYTSERCKQLSVRDLVILAAVGYAFPGATISELQLEPPPKSLWGKPSAGEDTDSKRMTGVPF